VEGGGFHGDGGRGGVWVVGLAWYLAPVKEYISNDSACYILDI
jgi:hypothetical protein